MRTKRIRQPQVRRAATAVEFAMVAPIMFLTVFACVEFGRTMMIEAFVEESAFMAARHVSVVGATKQEGIDIARDELALYGIQNAVVTVTPRVGAVTQGEIDENTETIDVSVSVTLSGNIAMGSFMNGRSIERTATTESERF
jgi:Flp pilus assembly protein TadG